MPKIIIAPNQNIDVVDSRLFANPTVANRRGGLADYADLDMDFFRQIATGDVSMKKGAEAIKRAIRNLVLTSHFERPFQSSIGTNVRRLLFEPISEMTSIYIRDFIVQCITNFEPRAILEDVRVNVDADNNGYAATIVFKPKNSIEPLVTTIFLERLR